MYYMPHYPSLLIRAACFLTTLSLAYISDFLDVCLAMYVLEERKENNTRICLLTEFKLF